MHRRQVLTSLGIAATAGVAGLVAARHGAVATLAPSSSPEPPRHVEPTGDVWHPEGYRQAFEYGEYSDQQLVIGLLDAGDITGTFYVFIESGAGRVDYFIDYETGEVYQDSSQSTNKEYVNVVTSVEVVDDTLYLVAETRAPGIGGPKIDYPSTWIEVEEAPLAELDRIAVSFTDRWGTRTSKTLPAEIPTVDLAYHQVFGVDYLVRDTAEWTPTDRFETSGSAAADVRTDDGLEVYLRLTVPQPTYDIDVVSASVTADRTLELDMVASMDAALGERDYWTEMDKVVAIMNRGEIEAVDLTVSGEDVGTHAFSIDL